MPAVRRLRPADSVFGASRVGDDHGCDQIMHKRVVIGPACDSVQPRLEHLEFKICELRGHSLEQEHGKILFFEHFTRKKLVR
jgi:hypothetical protein